MYTYIGKYAPVEGEEGGLVVDVEGKARQDAKVVGQGGKVGGL